MVVEEVGKHRRDREPEREPGPPGRSSEAGPHGQQRPAGAETEQRQAHHQEGEVVELRDREHARQRDLQQQCRGGEESHADQGSHRSRIVVQVQPR